VTLPPVTANGPRPVHGPEPMAARSAIG
jgi:hypothetical protein